MKRHICFLVLKQRLICKFLSNVLNIKSYVKTCFGKEIYSTQVLIQGYFKVLIFFSYLIFKREDRITGYNKPVIPVNAYSGQKDQDP